MVRQINYMALLFLLGFLVKMKLLPFLKVLALSSNGIKRTKKICELKCKRIS